MKITQGWCWACQQDVDLADGVIIDHFRPDGSGWNALCIGSSTEVEDPE